MDRIGELYIKAIEKTFVKRGHWVPGEEIELRYTTEHIQIHKENT